MTFNWLKIGADDYKCEHGDYLLRAEKMSTGHWWWCVYFGNGRLDTNGEHAKSKREAMKLAEMYCKRHKQTEK